MCLLASDRPSVMGQSQSIQERPDGKKQTDGLNLPVSQRARSKNLVLRGGIEKLVATSMVEIPTWNALE